MTLTLHSLHFIVYGDILLKGTMWKTMGKVKTLRRNLKFWLSQVVKFNTHCVGHVDVTWCQEKCVGARPAAAKETCSTSPVSRENTKHWSAQLLCAGSRYEAHLDSSHLSSKPAYLIVLSIITCRQSTGYLVFLTYLWRYTEIIFSFCKREPLRTCVLKLQVLYIFVMPVSSEILYF